MKITRDGNTFAVEVEHEAQANALEDVLRKLAEPATADPDPEPKPITDSQRRDYFLMECMKIVAASLSGSVIQAAASSSFAGQPLGETASEVVEAYVSALRRFNELIETSYLDPSTRRAVTPPPGPLSLG